MPSVFPGPVAAPSRPQHLLRLSMALVVALLCSACTGPDEATPALDHYTIDRAEITVSGISAGGYMATQLHVAHAQTFAGAAVLAAGPYYCAEGSLQTALARCLAPADEIPVAPLIAFTRDAASAARIDDTQALREDRVWLFRGSRDALVSHAAVAALADFYRAFVDPQNIRFVDDVAANHLIPTLDHGGACDALAPPFIGACGYDAAGELLAHLYGPLAPPVQPQGELKRFDQRPFADAAGSRGLGDTGFVYVPGACAGGASCRLHVALHGCEQDADTVGEAFVRHAGYNRWAESNRIVVLYPQAAKTTLPLNPRGCWDWWGYDDEQYMTRNGRQVRALHAMLTQLAAR